ncbi:MAG: SH3 domain-containing protein [Gammaproteobacteria bacterium]
MSSANFLLNPELPTLEQTIEAHLTETIQCLLDPSQQKTLAEDYLTRYFSPWTGAQSVATPAAMRQSLQDAIAQLEKSPGWSAWHQPYSAKWLKSLIENMALQNFPNCNETAIMLVDADVRVFPTRQPAFAEWGSATDGYPFDLMQNSFIAANTPIQILQLSQDGQWYFMACSSFFGWIQRQQIAFVDSAFRQTRQNVLYSLPAQEKVVATQRHQPPLSLRLGCLYPISEVAEEEVIILTTAADTHQTAVDCEITLPGKFLSPFPEPFNEQTISTRIKQVLGQPYGWGGMYGLRDCSSLMMDVLAGFGVWLPRNSREQAGMGKRIPLQHLTPLEKEQYIIEHGIPFLTLLYAPGHITLYVGARSGKAYMLHNAWRLGYTTITEVTYENKVGKPFLDYMECMGVLDEFLSF